MTGYREIRKGVYEPEDYTPPKDKLDRERLRRIIGDILTFHPSEETKKKDSRALRL